MAETVLKKEMLSVYTGACIILPTKHQKSAAINPAFDKIIGAGVMEYIADTDKLGTFSGEIERKGTALDCVRKKCEWAFKLKGVEYALASEGSFAPHPFIPFVPSNREILYFIDKKREFHLYVTDLFMETNYQMGEFSSFDDLFAFAEKALFPSHALIVRPYPRDMQGIVFKGIESKTDLEAAFHESMKASKTGRVWAETDMRAYVNPSRMKVIGHLAEQLAMRLAKHCPSCDLPGWGQVGREEGLPCEACGLPSEMTLHEIYGCVKCSYKEKLPRKDGLQQASPSQCQRCNP